MAATDGVGRPAVTERRMVLEQRFRIQFGVDPGFIEKIERIRSLLSTKHHGKLEFEELFEILIDEYIERHSPEGRVARKEEQEQKKAGREQKKTGKASRGSRGGRTGKPAKGAGSSSGASGKRMSSSASAAGSSRKLEKTRYIPQKVRDKVHARDKGRCTYVSPGGRRCESTWELQIDHIVPFARGGDNSPSNLRLLCAKHNRLEAERAYGKKHMEKHMKRFVKEQPERYCGLSGPVIRQDR